MNFYSCFQMFIDGEGKNIVHLSLVLVMRPLFRPLIFTSVAFLIRRSLSQ